MTVLSLDLGPRISNQNLYRAHTGDTICLQCCPELKGIKLNLTCTNPVGEEIVLRQDADRALFTLSSGGPYRVTWHIELYPLPLNWTSVSMVTILADPVLTSTNSGSSLTVDQIAAQSHLTKCCGEVQRWKDVFRVPLESGYNTIHLTPVQELGISKSSYSLHSHHKISSSLNLNSGGGYEDDLQLLSRYLQDIHNKTGLFFLTDVVWNHVSICNREILSHPESYYNLYNTPNLIPAYLIDRSIHEFGNTLDDIAVVQDLSSFEIKLRNHLLGTSQTLEKLYKIDLNKLLEVKKSTETNLCESLVSKNNINDVITAVWQVNYKKSEYAGDIDVRILRKFLEQRGVTSELDQNSKISAAICHFNDFEVPAIVDEILNKVIFAVMGTVKYRFLDEHGPKLSFGNVPIVDRYFHVPDIMFAEELTLDVYCNEDAQRIKTCNGWTTGESISDMNSTMAYTNREVVIWGDSVKLRYGERREDSPWLWDYMTKYTCDMASLFHGFRIDNCHNTPLHVGEELLRAARRVQPQLYIVAELFTGSEERDCEIINRMGINSCIRELSQSHSPRHLGELIYHYGESKPCGSFIQNISSGDQTCTEDNTSQFSLRSSRPHAMLMDQTHDNPCPFDQHPLPNVLALSGLMCAAKCSIGSNRGYDELVPHHIHVVEEERLYQGWSQSDDGDLKPAKKALIKLHQWLEDKGYSETFVDQAREDVVIVTRHHPDTCSKVLVVVATNWSEDSSPTSNHTVSLLGENVKVILETEILSSQTLTKHTNNKDYITGLPGVKIDVRENPQSSKMVTVSKPDEGNLNLDFLLTPGCVIVVEVEPPKSSKTALQYFNSYILCPEAFDKDLDRACSTLDLLDLNYVLYRCNEEEHVDGCGGVYHIPHHGNLTYAGIVGFLQVLETVTKNNDTGHPLCRNLCEGWWMADYTVNRLKKKNLKLGFFLDEIFFAVEAVPNYTRPKVFNKIIRSVYSACLRHISKLMPTMKTSVGNSWFVEQLVMTSVQLVGKVGDTGISVLPHNKSSVASLAAGLPHFSHGFMRCWGRDTFIALPGLLIKTGRLDIARDLVVGFARTLRYGLIPNLLSERGHRPRYNCRDAVWWWCRSVELLYKHQPSILHESVYRLFYKDDSPVPLETPFVCTVFDVITEVLERHASGITFREENAGRELDEHLLDPGFNMTAGVDPETGFIRGGSRHNCGTWMDKVGSSAQAGNKGIPATPRDGSAIELVAMGYQAVSWMAELFESGIGTTSEVRMKTGSTHKTVSFREWSEMIKENFEDKFWCAGGYYGNTDGYYRDTVGSDSGGDEKLRPNQTFAMVLAPDLFKRSHMSEALKTIGTKLAGLVGMCTLSPEDVDYQPYYDTGNHSNDYRTAHGFNYHQGPEWVWCMGFYLRAKLRDFQHLKKDNPDCMSDDEIGQYFATVLAPHRAMIASDPYRGLTELTNKGGQHCPNSCPTQAWSSGCLLEFLVELEQSDFSSGLSAGN